MKKTWKNHTPKYNTRVYAIWRNMLQRCGNPKNTHYKWYGGKGVTVCEEWKTSDGFIEWAKISGYTDTLTLDRIDGSLGYTPGNCRWVTRKAQSHNMRSNRMVTINGVTKDVVQWSEYSGINKNTLTKRLNSGCPPERLLTPVGELRI